jgi:hypothetical protein
MIIMENIKMQLSSQELNEYNKLREDGKEWYSYYRGKGRTHKEALAEVVKECGVEKTIECDGIIFTERNLEENEIECDGMLFTESEYQEYKKLNDSLKAVYKVNRKPYGLDHEQTMTMVAIHVNGVTIKRENINEDTIKQIIKKAFDWLKDNFYNTFSRIANKISELWAMCEDFLRRVFSI